MEAIESQLVDLQTRFAFQEDALQAVHDTLLRQQRQIEQLQEICRRLQMQNDELSAVVEEHLPNQRPPHY